jgi:hypothetical protein
MTESMECIIEGAEGITEVIKCIIERMRYITELAEFIAGTCKNFCVNGYTTTRSKYGLYKRTSG